MRKIGFILAIGFMAFPLCAQRPFWLQMFNQYTRQSAEEISQAQLAAKATEQALGQGATAQQLTSFLNHCADCSFQQAAHLHQTLAPSQRPLYGAPIQTIHYTEPSLANDIYPDLSFLKNATHTGAYFAFRNNRAYVSEVRRMQQFLPQLKARLPEMQQIAQQLEQPAHVIEWLVDKIPPQTQNLFLGEVHIKQDNIRQTIADLLPALRQKYPQREIILFTEFLPEKYVWGTSPRKGRKNIHTNYFPIWDTALKNQIRVVGLEKETTSDAYCFAQYIRPNGTIDHNTIWDSLEGARLRNESWKKILHQQRLAHPDALFIIYTGEGHSAYTYPFTLTSEGPTPQTFVVSFYPLVKNVFTKNNMQILSKRTGPIENLIEDIDFPQQVLYWDDPGLAKLAGFDVRIKVFTVPED